jgi:uncharacterized membrane protein (UPF0127 family)
MFRFCKILALSLVVMFSACSDEGKAPAQSKTDEAAIISPATGDVKNTFQIDVADTKEKLLRGLMGRTSMDENYGLLFDIDLAPKDDEIAFWMKDTLIPLDMLFMDENGVVFFVHKNAQPNDVTPIRPPKRPRAVLEINAGQVDKYGIDVGDQMKADLFGNK